jgi:hypothetical protein
MLDEHLDPESDDGEEGAGEDKDKTETV